MSRLDLVCGYEDIKAEEAMFPVMEKRGLAHREEGKIVCDY